MPLSTLTTQETTTKRRFRHKVEPKRTGRTFDNFSWLTPQDVAKLFGHQITELRKAKGWTARELAKRAGITPAQLCRIEKGRLDVSLSTMLALSRAFQCKLRTLSLGIEGRADDMGRSGIRGKDSRDWHHDDVDGYDSRYWGLDDGLADRLGIKAPDGWKPKSRM
jgi:transcriptional regulator with XRE-family HTH domain